MIMTKRQIQKDIIGIMQDYIKQVNPTQEQIKWAKQLTEQILKCTLDNTIEVISDRCALGKSTLINSILKNTSIGAIFITDRLDRLDITATLLKDDCYYMHFTEEEIDSKKIFLEQKSKRVLLMTTQRYFSLSKEEIESYSTWKDGKRELVIIDEKPPIIEVVEITNEYINSIENATEMEVRDITVKNAIKNNITLIRNSFNTLLDSFADKKVGFYRGNGLFVTEQFIQLVKDNLTREYYNRALNIKQLQDGSLYIGSGNDDNTRKLVFAKNNIDKFVDCYKYFILDATAKIDNDYFFNWERLNPPVKAQLEKPCDITINHIELNTSKRKLKDVKYKEMVKTIVDKYRTEDTLVTSSRNYSNFFGAEGYFGNLTGKNTWADKTNYIQVGVNRKSNYYYVAKYFLMVKDGITQLTIEEVSQLAEELISNIDNIKLVESDNEALREKSFVTLIMKSDTKVETVQALMRIKCRHFSNTEMCNVWLITDRDVSDIARYVGANLVELETPMEAEILKTLERKAPEGKKETNAQRIINHWNELPFTNGVVTNKQIMEYFGLDKKQFDKTKEKSSGLKMFLDSKRVSRGKYSI